MQLLRADTGEELMSGAFDAVSIGEGQILTIESESPIETVVHNVPHALI